MIELAERELLSPLDIKARALILNAAKRVSVVTAVSPRAVVDLAYVLFEVVRLVRSMANLYGGRPGSFGMLRLLRDVFAHLAIAARCGLHENAILIAQRQGQAVNLWLGRIGDGPVQPQILAQAVIKISDIAVFKGVFQAQHPHLMATARQFWGKM